MIAQRIFITFIANISFTITLFKSLLINFHIQLNYKNTSRNTAYSLNMMLTINLKKNINPGNKCLIIKNLIIKIIPNN